MENEMLVAIVRAAAQSLVTIAVWEGAKALEAYLRVRSKRR
jgi:hypothetical protein